MGEDDIQYYKKYVNEDGVESLVWHDTCGIDLEGRLRELAIPISTEYMETEYAVTTTNSTGDYWNSTSNYTYDPITNTFILGGDNATTATDTYYTMHRPYIYKDKFCTMTCEHCGEEQRVLTEDFRVGYICDTCKSSVPLLTVLRRYFRTINW